MQITYFKSCPFWGIGAAAIGGLIYDELLQQDKGLPLDFNPHEFYDDRWTEDWLRSIERQSGPHREDDQSES